MTDSEMPSKAQTRSQGPGGAEFPLFRGPTLKTTDPSLQLSASTFEVLSTFALASSERAGMSSPMRLKQKAALLALMPQLHVLLTLEFSLRALFGTLLLQVLRRAATRP